MHAALDKTRTYRKRACGGCLRVQMYVSAGLRDLIQGRLIVDLTACPGIAPTILRTGHKSEPPSSSSVEGSANAAENVAVRIIRSAARTGTALQPGEQGPGLCLQWRTLIVVAACVTVFRYALSLNT